MNLPPKAQARHRKESQVPVRCNAIRKTGRSINIYLRPNEAIQVARSLLRKALLLIEEGELDDGWAIKVWNVGKNSRALKFGIDRAVMKPRKKPK